MKFSLKTLAAAVALVAVAGTASAAIDNGAGGNGELFFSIWDANGSYTRDLNITIDAYQADLAATGNQNLSWAADASFSSFLASVANPAALNWSVVAADRSGAVRLLSTYSNLPSSLKKDDATRNATSNARDFATSVNSVIGAGDSVAVDSASVAWAGKATFSNTLGNYLGFSNAGTLANNSFDAGLGFMRIDAKALNLATSVYTPYSESTSAVRAWVDVNNTLHIAAVPEPSEYAMLLAGLGLIGAVARRRSRKQA